MELSMWKNSGQFFDWQGHSIFVQDTAAPNKPVLLLIHGFPTSSYDFHLMWPELAETHRLVAFDMPFTLIDGVEDPISGEHMVQRFEELVPGKQTIRLAGLGHYPHLEDAAKVLAVLKPLLHSGAY